MEITDITKWDGEQRPFLWESSEAKKPVYFAMLATFLESKSLILALSRKGSVKMRQVASGGVWNGLLNGIDGFGKRFPYVSAEELSQMAAVVLMTIDNILNSGGWSILAKSPECVPEWLGGEFLPCSDCDEPIVIMTLSEMKKMMQMPAANDTIN